MIKVVSIKLVQLKQKVTDDIPPIISVPSDSMKVETTSPDGIDLNDSMANI
jgi:hypothetical protein